MDVKKSTVWIRAEVFADLINPGIIGSIDARQHVSVNRKFQPAQCLSQIPRRKF